MEVCYVKKFKRFLYLFVCLALFITVFPAGLAWNGTDPSQHQAQGIGNLYDYDYVNYVPGDWLEDTWRPVGVGGGGAVFMPRFSPLDPGLWLAFCDMGSAYVTQDAGYTWAMINFGGTWTSGTGFFFDLNDENVVYATPNNAGLWKSTDKGSNWVRIFPHEDRSYTYHRTDHADVWYGVIPGTCTKPGCEHAFGERTQDDPGDEIPGALPGANMAKDLVGYPKCDPPDGFPYQGAVTSMAIDPTDSNKLYVIVTQTRGSRGGSSIRDHLYYSDDGGESFAQIANDITTYNTSAGAPFNLPNFNITTQTRTVDNMIVEPTSGDVMIFTGSSAAGNGGIVRYGADGAKKAVPAMVYSDGGGTDTTLATISQAEFLWDGTDILYYFLSSSYIYKTADLVNFERLTRGVATLPATPAPGTGSVTVSNFDVSNEDVIWYNNGQNVYRSVDGGQTWSHVWRGIGGRGNTATDIDRWAGFGAEFTYWQDYAVQFGTGWSTGMSNQPRASKADPGVYGGGNNGYLVVTRNGGELWGAPHTKIVNGYDDRGNRIDTFVTTGFNVTTTYGVHFDPFNPKHCFMTITDVGLFQSWDGGYSWRHSGICGMLPPAYRPNGTNASGQSINDFVGNIGNGDSGLSGWSNTCYWITFDPLIPDKVYGAWSGTHDVARLRYFPLRESSSESGIGGVTISMDGGRTWRTVNQSASESAASGLPQNVIAMHIELGPVDTVTGNVTLYLATHGKGFFKSVDSGEHWVQINNGVDQVAHKYDEGKTPGSGEAYDVAHPNSRYFGRKIVWVDDGSPDGVVYGMIARSGAEFVGEPSGQLYRSYDGGASWQKCTMPQNDGAPRPANYVSDFAYDPRNPTTVYAACWQSSNGNPSYLMPDPGDELPNSGGVFVSHDAGDTWSPIWGPDRHVYGIQVDPYNPNNLFAVTFEGQMMIMQYEGESAELYTGDGYDAGAWDIHQEYGFNFRQASSPFIDPNHPDYIFVSSFGGNIWRGPSHVAPKLGSLTVGGAPVDVDPNVYEYKVVVMRPVDNVTIDAAGVYDTAVLSGSGLGNVALAYGDNFFDIEVANEIESMTSTYTVNVYREPASAFAFITGPASVVTGAGATATYTVWADMRIPVSGVELEFEIDGSILSSNSFSAESGFEFFGDGNYSTPILWKNVGNTWIGKVTLLNTSGPDVVGVADLFSMTFNVREGELGSTDVKLNYIIMSYKDGQVVTMIEEGVASTDLLQWYSKYDLNKDGVIDLNDLTYALQFLGITSADPEWVDAQYVNFDDTNDAIDINDLILILANYTIPYYS